MEEGIAHCLGLEGAFVDMVTVQRCVKARLPNNHFVLGFEEATVVEASHHGVPDSLAFESQEGSDIQLGGVYNLDLLSPVWIVFEVEVHHLRLLLT